MTYVVKILSDLINTELYGKYNYCLVWNIFQGSLPLAWKDIQVVDKISVESAVVSVSFKMFFQKSSAEVRL